MHIQTDEEYPVNQECTERKSAEAGMSCNVANPKWIRKQSLPYFTIWIFYYAWVIVFATWWTASPLTENTFGAGLRSVMHAVNLLSSAAFILLLRKEWFVRAARIGAALIIAGMSVYLAVSDPRVQTVSVLVVSVSLGLVNISILMPFVFALNNTEKLYAVIGSNALIGFLLLFWEQGGKDFLSSRDVLLLSFGLIVLTLAATVFFREDCLRNDVPVKEYNRPRMHFGAYMMLILSCVFGVLGKGVGKGILNVAAVGSDFPLMTIYHIGSLLGCLVYVIIYAFAGKCIYLTWNLAFGLLATGLLLNGFVFQAPELAVVFAFLFGIGNTIGMLPQGYATVLEGDGSGLSQGQRQLISIARAAVADPPVMILDEATSSIDTRTEAIVQKGMDALMKGRTVFVIAHRLSTVQNSDAIMVLEDGRIIERGSHEQLIEEKGKYYQLYTGAFELE